MNPAKKHINVYRTVDPSVIISIKSQLAEILTGIDPNKMEGISFYVGELGNVTYNFVGEFPTELQVGPKIMTAPDLSLFVQSFFVAKNELLKKQIGLEFDFFPLGNLKQTGKAFYSQEKNTWQLIYTFHVSTIIENKSLGKFPVPNTFLELEFTLTGNLVSMTYDLLPIKSAGKARLLHADKEELPQIVYLLNPKLERLAPFYLADLEQGYLPATNESVHPDENNSCLKKNPAIFDADCIIKWIRTNNLSGKLKVKNGSENPKTKKSILVRGAKVIRLKQPDINSDKAKILFWSNGVYNQAFVPKTILSPNYNLISNYSDNNLRNEIEHLLWRVAGYRSRQVEFDQVITRIENNKSIRFNKKQAIEKMGAFVNKTRIDRADKPASIKRAFDAIFAVYDPINEKTNKKYSEETMVIPLSEEWFKKDPLLEEEYNRTWYNRGYGLGGFSGEGIPEEDAEIFRKALYNLRAIVGKTNQRFSPEAAWLQSLKPKVLLSNKYRRLVSIFKSPWYFDSKSKYASDIGLELSFGGFRIPPVMTVMIHEFIVHPISDRFGAFYYDEQRDTHVGFNNTKDAWTTKILDVSDIEQSIESNAYVNDLYINHRIHAAIGLAAILKIITE